MSGYYQKFGTTYYDLNTIFSSYVTGQDKADTTKFTNSSGIDLNYIFKKVSNQPTNLTVNYGFKSAFQSIYFTPTATCSISSDTNSATISITAAAFNKLEITGSGTQTISGVSGTLSYSKSFTGLAPDSNYSYTCTPSNTGTSPAATNTALAGTATTVSTNTLPIVKGVTAVPASATSITVSWGATGASDCSYSNVNVGRSTTSGGTLTSLTTQNNTTNTFTNTGLTAGTTYYYTVTPYNKTGSAGTAVTCNSTTTLNSTITTFTFKNVSGTTDTTILNTITAATSGTISFNATISNFTSATLSNGNNSATIGADFTTGTISLAMAPSYNTYTLSVYGGITVVTSQITCIATYTEYTVPGTAPINANNQYSLNDSTITGYPFYYWYGVIGGGGGGGGGGYHYNGGGAGGGGGGGGAFASGYRSYTGTTASVNFNVNMLRGRGGNGGLAADYGNDPHNGKEGTDGTSSILSVPNLGISQNNYTDGLNYGQIYIKAEGGHRGYTGDGNGSQGAIIPGDDHSRGGLTAYAYYNGIGKDYYWISITSDLATPTFTSGNDGGLATKGDHSYYFYGGTGATARNLNYNGFITAYYGAGGNGGNGDPNDAPAYGATGGSIDGLIYIVIAYISSISGGKT